MVSGAVTGAQRADAGRGPRRTLLVVVLAAAAVLALIVVVALTRPAEVDVAARADGPPLLTAQPPPDDTPLPGATLPPLGAFGPEGGLALPDSGGQPMVINFWASWCAPCVNEMPMLQRVADDVGIRLIGVDFIDQPDDAIELAERLDIRYTLVRDDRGAYGEKVGLLGTPTTLLVDGDGVVRRRLTGEVTEEQFRGAIADGLGRR